MKGLYTFLLLSALTIAFLNADKEDAVNDPNKKITFEKLQRKFPFDYVRQKDEFLNSAVKASLDNAESFHSSWVQGNGQNEKLYEAQSKEQSQAKGK